MAHGIHGPNKTTDMPGVCPPTVRGWVGANFLGIVYHLTAQQAPCDSRAN